MRRRLITVAICLLMSGCGEKDDTGRVEILGGFMTQLTTDRGADPAWSPDGSEIAYVRSQNLRLISADGGEPAAITDLPGMEFNPRWNPVSGKRQLVFGNTPASDNFKIYTLDLDEGTPVEIYNSGQILAYPCFNHDGTKVIFTPAMTNRGIMVIPAEGGEAEEIPNSEGWQRRVLCVYASPVDPTVCYIEQALADYFLVTIPLEGGAPTDWARVTSDASTRSNLSYSTYSQDGARITVIMRDQIMYITSPGTDLIQLTHRREDGGFSNPSWSPDGKQIVSAHNDQLWILTIK